MDVPDVIVPNCSVSVWMASRLACVSDRAAGLCAEAVPTTSIGRPAVNGAKATVPAGAARLEPGAKATRSAVSDRVRPVGTVVGPANANGVGGTKGPSPGTNRV